MLLKRRGYWDRYVWTFRDNRIPLTRPPHPSLFMEGLHLHSVLLGSKNYHWKGHTALIEYDTRLFITALHTWFLESHYHKLGTLIIKPKGQKLLDIIVISYLVSDEGKLAVSSPLSPLTDIDGVNSELYWSVGLDIVLIVEISYVGFWFPAKWNYVNSI
jgi:hypothetical protein